MSFYEQKAGPIPPSMEVVGYVYDNTSPGAPIRRLLVDWYAWNVRNFWFKTVEAQELLREIPEFAVDLLLAVSKRRNIDHQEAAWWQERTVYMYLEVEEAGVPSTESNRNRSSHVQ